MSNFGRLTGTLGAECTAGVQARDVAEKRYADAAQCETAIQKASSMMNACRSLEELQERMGQIQDRLVNLSIKIGAALPPSASPDKDKPERNGLIGFLEKTASDAHQRCQHIETVLRSIENTF